ncbi:MAG: hypothetical protein FIB08_06830 [Candidatus Methanoperedens sp.]|nr:hypothetical protein [Candidatus Methanoperedens sp.]
MGFSTSAAVVIFAASFMYLATIFYPLANLSNQRVLEAKKSLNDMQEDKLNTKIVITNSQVSGSDIDLTVYNNGSVTLNSSKLNVIYDGTFLTSFSISSQGVWAPRSPINVTIVNGVTGKRVKIITANGASDYAIT